MVTDPLDCSIGGQMGNDVSFSSLSQLVSRICSIVFNETPRLNNELINRTNVSNTIANAGRRL